MRTAVQVPGCGRDQVRTEFFCFLDDDDVYLPDAMKHRLAPMMADPTIDVFVSNGYQVHSGRPEAVIQNFPSVVAAPIQALMTLNWLLSPSGLYRVTTIPADFFDDTPRYFEWTLLAFRIAFHNKNIAFVPAFTYRINDTPNSLSKRLPIWMRRLASCKRC